jgi:hypothetical protein
MRLSFLYNLVIELGLNGIDIHSADLRHLGDLWPAALRSLSAHWPLLRSSPYAFSHRHPPPYFPSVFQIQRSALPYGHCLAPEQVRMQRRRAGSDWNFLSLLRFIAALALRQPEETLQDLPLGPEAQGPPGRGKYSVNISCRKGSRGRRRGASGERRQVQVQVDAGSFCHVRVLAAETRPVLLLRYDHDPYVPHSKPNQTHRISTLQDLLHQLLEILPLCHLPLHTSILPLPCLLQISLPPLPRPYETPSQPQLPRSPAQIVLPVISNDPDRAVLGLALPLRRRGGGGGSGRKREGGDGCFEEGDGGFPEGIDRGWRGCAGRQRMDKGSRAE